MNRIDTLFRSILVAAPLALAACAGASADDTATASKDPAVTTQHDVPATAGDAPGAANENGPGDSVALNADGVPMGELETNVEVEGSEGEDPGYAESLSTSATAAPESDDGVGQRTDALLGTRGSSLRTEALRTTDFLNRPASYYSHTTYMNESTGTRRTDCSGLTGYLLSRAVPGAITSVPKPNWRAKPLAEDYFDYIATRPTSASQQTTARWRRMLSVKDLKPGDMIVWKYPSTNPNTGHIMIVRDYPRVGRTDRSEWIVPIVDSTSTPHAYNAWDSRGTTYTGVGQGTIGLKIDSSGAPYAYYWTGGTSPTAVYKSVMMARIE